MVERKQATYVSKIPSQMKLAPLNDGWVGIEYISHKTPWSLEVRCGPSRIEPTDLSAGEFGAISRARRICTTCWKETGVCYRAISSLPLNLNSPISLVIQTESNPATCIASGLYQCMKISEYQNIAILRLISKIKKIHKFSKKVSRLRVPYLFQNWSRADF